MKDDATILLVDGEPHVADLAFECLDTAGMPVVRVPATDAASVLAVDTFACVVVCVARVPASPPFGGEHPYVVLALHGRAEDAEDAVATGAEDALCGPDLTARQVVHRVRCAAVRARRRQADARHLSQSERVTAVGLVAEAVADALRPVAALLGRSIENPEPGGLRALAQEVGDLLADVEGFVAVQGGPVGEA